MMKTPHLGTDADHHESKPVWRKVNIPVNETRARKAPQKLLFMFPGMTVSTGWRDLKAARAPPSCSGSRFGYFKSNASQTAT